MKATMNRRELLVGASGLACAGCATMPRGLERLPGAAASHAEDRVCDHDLCRSWRSAGDVAPAPPGEPRVGRCSVGVPEGL